MQKQRKSNRDLKWLVEKINYSDNQEKAFSKDTLNLQDMDLIEDTVLELEISKDHMKAYISVAPPKNGKMITLEEVLEELQNAGVVHGIDETKISEVLNKGPYYSKVLVAAGTSPQTGENGRIIYHFDTKKELKPRVSQNGTVDFHNLDLVTNVTKGQLLAQIIPPTKGISGKTILGKVIPARDGKEARVVLGKGVFASQDGLQIYSDINGQPNLLEGKLSVLSVFDIKGDVGPATGNIDFLGTVIVRGSVKSGFMIKAEGDIEVEGTVEDSVLEAQGNILLKRGMQGRGKGEIRAGKNVLARYIENTQVEAGQDIVISEAAMHSILLAGRKVEITGRKGLLVGGVCRAGEELVAKTIGSPMATYTEIEVGTRPDMKNRCLEINDRLQELEKNLLSINQALNVISRTFKNQIPSDKQMLLKKLTDTLEASQQEQRQLSKEKQQLDERMSTYCRAKVSASNTLYPGVFIIIGNASMKIRDKMEFTTFYNYEGRIKIGTYEG